MLHSAQSIYTCVVHTRLFQLTLLSCIHALQVAHCALSLVGEPIMYPEINAILTELHKRHISSFLVTNAQFPDRIRHLVPITQLYVSVDAATRDTLKVRCRECAAFLTHMVLLLNIMIGKLTVHGIQCSLLTHTTPNYCSHLVVAMLVQLSKVRCMLSIPNHAAHISSDWRSPCDRHADYVLWRTGN